MMDFPEIDDSSSSYQQVPDSALYSHEAEYALIGSMIQQSDLIDEAGGKLSIADFHHPACAELFEVVLGLHSRGRAVDVVTICEARPFLADGQSSVAVVGLLVQNTPSAANFDEYARVVKQRSVARRVIAAARIMSQRLIDGEPLDEVMSQGQQAWVSLEAEGLDSRRRYR